MSMITPGTLLLNKGDRSNWYVLLSYEVVGDSVRDVVWFNIKNNVILNRYSIACSSLTQAALGNHYIIIEP